MSTLRVLGGPGTGKTTLLVEAAAAQIAAGLDPESVLLLTPQRLVGPVRAAVTMRLLRAAGGGVVREPLVRSVHSYAFSVLAKAAQRAGDPPPRLVTGAEQDGIIRELLAGEVEDGATGWPAPLRPALGTAGFATELRDLMARCAERGIDPAELKRLGRLHGRPVWVAAGRFAQQYEQVMLLRAAVGTAAPQATVPALGAAELVGAALEVLGSDGNLLAAEQARIALLLVDDAQHLDPQAARLVRLLAGGATLAVLAGDPNQAVFGYRGADPALLRSGARGQVITLDRSHRCAPAITRAVNALAARLPGALGTPLRPAAGRPGSVRVTIAATPAAEAAVIADTLRRAHLLGEVPWSQMAVIVRSVPRAGVDLARALAGLGVPVEQPASGTTLAGQPAVRALLTVLEAALSGLDGDRALELITGPIGRVDPVSLRQLRRALRRADGSRPPREFTALLAQALGPEVGLSNGVPPELRRPLSRVAAVLTAARRSADADPRTTLWQAWSRTGLQRRWLAAGDRGGAVGAQAERDLDAITALFDVAEQYVNRTPGSTLRGFVDHVQALGLPMTPSERRPEAVTVLSAHAALGREFEVVAVAGLQEGLWPNTIPRGGVLRTQQLIDLIDGVTSADETVSATAPLLAEERRLLIAALGRARAQVLVTAVDSDTGDDSMLPSEFVRELAAVATGPADDQPVEPVRAPRVLAPAAVVGRLRAVVCAPDGDVDAAVRSGAAQQLARLARAGVAGADPGQWYGMTPVSTEEPLWSPEGHEVTLSPSKVQQLTECPLRWLLERHGGGDTRDVRSAVGSLVHALISDSGRSPVAVADELEKLWEKMPFDSGWYSDNELERHRTMLAAFAEWRAATRAEFTEIGTEVDVTGQVCAAGPAHPAVRVQGRLDRLERDAEGRLVVIDVKTGKSPVTKDDAQHHAQLAVYQLAIAAGLLAQGDQPGGGRLVYLGKPGADGPAQREQDPMTPDGQAEWEQRVREAAGATQGPEFAARVNDGCAHCPVRSSCPAQSGGQRS